MGGIPRHDSHGVALHLRRRLWPPQPGADGAGPWQVYRRVTLPLLRPSLLVAVVLNAIYVFNSFPIIWLITGMIPGYDTDTTITFMYKVAFGPGSQLDAGEAAALAVLNVLFLLAVVTIYLRHITWDETD